jgi:hypothetical protein
MKEKEKVARPARLELATLCLEGSGLQILSALSSVAYGRVHSKACSSVGLHGLQSLLRLRLPVAGRPWPAPKLLQVIAGTAYRLLN